MDFILTSTQITDLMVSKVTSAYFSLSHFSHFGKLNGRSRRSRSRRKRSRNSMTSRIRNLLIFNLILFPCLPKKPQPIKSCVLKPGFLRHTSGKTFEKASDKSSLVFTARNEPNKTSNHPQHNPTCHFLEKKL